ncbi:DUF3455 domain-containing protein [Trinickia sp. LjRoot230]|uniref:DUF3455 domain-containing protein n=1 Tax=Trinickia sp. LjRoot230 TaxID=3342288 RepID=UPI003ECF2B78
MSLLSVTRRHRISLALLTFYLLTAITAAHAEESIPAPLNAPDVSPFISTRASGVQIYACEYDRDHHLSWTLQRPDATLYDASGRSVAVHGAGPSWQAPDGSRVVGKVIAQAASQNRQSIPQLLLEVHSTADGTLAAARFVQRLDTVGGLPPADSCGREHETGKSPYLARYVFLK